MVVHEHQHVLVALSVRSSERPHDVAVYESPDMRWFVAAALVRHVGGIRLSAVLAGDVMHLMKVRRCIGGEVRETPYVVRSYVQTAM